MRQRLDEGADDLLPLANAGSITFLKTAGVPMTPLWTGHAALDFDVFSQLATAEQAGHARRWLRLVRQRFATGIPARSRAADGGNGRCRGLDWDTGGLV